MPTATVTSMELRRSSFCDLSAAAKRGAVIITTYGKPTHALLTFEKYQELIAPETPVLASEIGQGFSPGIPTHKKSRL